MRPKVDLHKRRSQHAICVYPTHEEKEAIRSKAASLGISMSELLISSAIDRKLSFFDLETKQLVHELLKVRSNVNHIARHVNLLAHQEVAKEQQLECCKQNFGELLGQIEEVLASLKKQ